MKKEPKLYLCEEYKALQKWLKSLEKSGKFRNDLPAPSRRLTLRQVENKYPGALVKYLLFLDHYNKIYKSNFSLDLSKHFFHKFGSKKEGYYLQAITMLNNGERGCSWGFEDGTWDCG